MPRRWAPPHNPQRKTAHPPLALILCWLGLRLASFLCFLFSLPLAALSLFAERWAGPAPLTHSKKRARRAKTNQLHSAPPTNSINQAPRFGLIDWIVGLWLSCSSFAAGLLSSARRNGPPAQSSTLNLISFSQNQMELIDGITFIKIKLISLKKKKRFDGRRLSFLWAGCLRLAAAYNPPIKDSLPPSLLFSQFASFLQQMENKENSTARCLSLFLAGCLRLAAALNPPKINPISGPACSAALHCSFIIDS